MVIVDGMIGYGRVKREPFSYFECARPRADQGPSSQTGGRSREAENIRTIIRIRGINRIRPSPLLYRTTANQKHPCYVP